MRLRPQSASIRRGYRPSRGRIFARIGEVLLALFRGRMLGMLSKAHAASVTPMNTIGTRRLLVVRLSPLEWRLRR
jgi:hypothetical protein